MDGFHKNGVLFFLVVVFLLGLAVSAAIPAATEVATQEPLVIYAGQSRILNTPWAVEQMSVTNPKVADVEPIGPKQVLVLGRTVGTTDLVMWTSSGEVTQRRVDVRIDLDRLREELRSLLPGASLRVQQTQDVVVVSGRLAGPQQADSLEKFLKAASKATGMEFTDMTESFQPPPEVLAAELGMTPEVLKEHLVRLFPDAQLEVYQSGEVFTISGMLRRTEQAEQMRRYLEALEASAEQQSRTAGVPTTGPAGGGVVPEAPVRGFRFVDMTTVAGVQQVQIQVRVAEVSRTAIRALGLNALWSGHHDNTFWGADLVGSATGGALNPISIGPPAGALAGPHEAAQPVFTADVTVSPLVTLLFGWPRADLQFFVQALAENQYLRVLAEPNLVALSGEEASFLAGGEFPIPIVQGASFGGGLSITIEYKEFGVRLRFRPTVLGDGTIRLHVAPEVSQLTETGAVEIQGFRVPSLSTRRAETTLELKSGQTFSMAGLLNSSGNGRNSRVPGLGDVPVLGALFRSVRYEKGETELVVLVTPSLVEPLNLASPPPLPGAMDRDPDDWELYGEGLIVGKTPRHLPAAQQDWIDRLGLDRLEGPGAWEEYESQPASPDKE